MQFTKVHQELAKPVYEAIPKIAEKAGKKWEWEPEVGETCIVNWNSEPMIIYAVEENKQIVYASRFTATDESNGYRQSIKHLTPILDWGRIVEILEGMGHKVKVRDQEDFGEDCRYNCGIYTDKLGVGRSASTCQEAFQRAILALLEQLEEKQ